MLKEALARVPVLHFPRWDQMFYIETDASGLGLRAASPRNGNQRYSCQ